MNPRGMLRRRHLPHWDVPGAAYFVTACLHGTVGEETAELDAVRRLYAQARRRGDRQELERVRLQYIKAFIEADRVWDCSPRLRWLEKPELAAEVRNSICRFAGDRYDVFSYVVMASHWHWLFRPTPRYEAAVSNEKHTPRELIMKSVKNWTARQCNRLLVRKGTFWQDESYDHWVRDDKELYWIMEYIENNPVKAGLTTAPESFEFSSAHDRRRWGVAEGLPLLPPSP